jgi:ferredoxin-NADP reductase
MTSRRHSNSWLELNRMWIQEDFFLIRAGSGHPPIPAYIEAIDRIEEQLEAFRFVASRYHETQNTVNALAERIAELEDVMAKADVLADAYGRYWARDEKFYAYEDARKASNQDRAPVEVNPAKER